MAFWRLITFFGAFSKIPSKITISQKKLIFILENENFDACAPARAASTRAEILDLDLTCYVRSKKNFHTPPYCAAITWKNYFLATYIPCAAITWKNYFLATYIPCTAITWQNYFLTTYIPCAAIAWKNYFLATYIPCAAITWKNYFLTTYIPYPAIAWKNYFLATYSISPAQQ